MKKLFALLVLFVFMFIFFNCGTPNEPESLIKGDGGYKIVSKYATSGFAQDVIIKDTIVYIAQGEGGLLILNISDPKKPKLISSLSSDLRGYSYKIARKDSIIYLAAGNFGISVVNAADPFHPATTVVNLPMKPAQNLSLMGNYLFTPVSEQGVNISEISYPAEPDVRSTIETPGYAQSVAITNDNKYLFIACGEMGLTILNISDFQDGFATSYPVSGWTDTPGYTEDLVLHPTLNVAFIACGTGGICIADFSDSSNIKIVSKFDTKGYAKEIFYENDKIYVTTELAGLQIFDVKNLALPTLIGTVQTEYAKGITVNDKYIYVADEDEGLIIISKP